MNTNERIMEVKTFALVKTVKEKTEYKNCDIRVNFELSNGVHGYDEKGKFTYTFLDKKPVGFIISPKYLTQIDVVEECHSMSEFYEKRDQIIENVRAFANAIHHAKKAYGYITANGHKAQRMVNIIKDDETEDFYILDETGCPLKVEEGDYDICRRQLTVNEKYSFAKKAWNITDWFYGI